MSSVKLRKFSDPIFPPVSALVVKPGLNKTIKSVHRIDTDNLIERAMNGEAPGFIVADPRMLRHMVEARDMLAHLGLDPIQQARAVFAPWTSTQELRAASRTNWMARINAGVAGAQGRGAAVREINALRHAIGALKGLRGTPEASSPSEIHKLSGHIASLWSSGVADVFARARHNAERLKDADVAHPLWRDRLLEDVIARAERRLVDLDRVTVNLRPPGSEAILDQAREGCPVRVAPALATMDPRIAAALMMQFGRSTDPDFWAEACIQSRETLNGFRVPFMISHAARTDQRGAIKRLTPPWESPPSRKGLAMRTDPLTGAPGALMFNLRRVVDARDVERHIMMETREGRADLKTRTPDVWRAKHRERLMDGWRKLRPDVMVTLHEHARWTPWVQVIKSYGLEPERPSQ